MHLIFGGYAQGRLSYALKTYHKNRADVFDCAARPLSEWNLFRSPCNRTKPR